MKEMQKLIEQQGISQEDSEGLVRYIGLVAYAPFYAQMFKLLYSTMNGERNPDFSRIIPLIGQMHLAMAFQDALKYILWDSGLDSLAPGAGLSLSLIEVFREKKEYKPNVSFFRKSAVVWMARIQDVLF